MHLCQVHNPAIRLTIIRRLSRSQAARKTGTAPPVCSRSGEPDLPSLAGELLGRARAGALPRGGGVRAGPEAPSGAGGPPRRGVRVPVRALLPRKALLRANVRTAAERCTG